VAAPSLPESEDQREALERPFRKTLADVYEFLALGVGTNIAALLMLFLAASAGFPFTAGPDWAPFAASLAALTLLAPAVAWGLGSLSLAMTRRDEPSFWMLFRGFGRAYPRAVAYFVIGLSGAALVSFMVWFWSRAPIAGSSVELGIAALWLGAGVLGAAAHLLGWPVLVLSEGKPLYTLRLVLALLGVSPRVSAGFLAHLLLFASIMLLPLVSQWQGLAAGFCVMFTVFVSLFWTGLLTANVALRLIQLLAERKEALEADENTCPSEEECVDG
jgi:hypothetical protein